MMENWPISLINEVDGASRREWDTALETAIKERGAIDFFWR